METEHTETVMEKAVSYVKEALGIHPAEPDVQAKPEYSDAEPEIDTKEAILLNPNAYAPKSIGELSSENSPSPEVALAIERAEATNAGETEDERLRREEAESIRQPTALELNSESARLEDGE